MNNSAVKPYVYGLSQSKCVGRVWRLRTAPPEWWIIWSVLVLLMTVALNSVSFAASIAPPPSEISSPDGMYSVRILDTALPGSDPYRGFYTLELLRRGTVLSKHATEGYLLEAFWSSDGKFVAVNNRRGSSGDYLWIFRLSDGKALKEPNDNETPSFVSRVQAKFHDLSTETFNRRYTLARGWDTSKHLRVRTSLQFFNLDDAEIHIDQLCTIEKENLSVTREVITKASTAKK
jgi:hypothetical protein